MTNRRATRLEIQNGERSDPINGYFTTELEKLQNQQVDKMNQAVAKSREQAGISEQVYSTGNAILSTQIKV